MTIQEQVSLFGRGAENLITEESLIKKLESNKPLEVKFGIDPTAPDIHLGHTVPLQRLRHFQKYGHNVTIIVGDFTAQIGDPSGKSTTRPMLTPEDIKLNVETYKEQVFKVVDPDQTKLVFNSSWLGKLDSADLIRIASKSSVQQLLQRRDFSKRIQEGRPLSVAELIYPILVGYDSVELGTDVEIGGTDQLYNFMASRAMQSAYGQEQEVVITLPLLKGLDGKQKMSKSLGNAIGVKEKPEDMYGKILSISDEQMVEYYELLSDISNKELVHVRNVVESGNENPLTYKQKLAFELVSRYHSRDLAKTAEDNFNRIVRGIGDSDNLEVMKINYYNDSISLIDLIQRCGKASSNSEARRLLQGGAVRIDGSTIEDLSLELKTNTEYDLRLGKKFYKHIVFNQE